MNGKDFFIPQKPVQMTYHEYLDYWVCSCKNFEKKDGFLACDKYGDLVCPIGATHCRCERCGRVIYGESHTIIGRNLCPDRGRF